MARERVEAVVGSDDALEGRGAPSPFMSSSKRISEPSSRLRAEPPVDGVLNAIGRIVVCIVPAGRLL
jgi:hypothetical protein